MSDLVSIIIPVYNRERLVAKTINSVRCQSYNNWECIVVDDGSHDETVKIVQRYCMLDERVKLISRPEERIKGASTCRNIGVEYSKGDCLIFLDSDDLLASRCLKERLKVLQEFPEVDLAVFPMQFFKYKPGDLGQIWNKELDQSHLVRFLSLDSVWQTTGGIWRKSGFELIEGFNEKLACWQDIDIHLKAILKLNVSTFYTYKPDCFYRVHNNGTISQQNINSLPKLRSREELYRWVLNQSNFSRRLAKPMALSIFVSAVRSMNFKFGLKFMYNSKQSYTLKELFVLTECFFFYLFRLYKIKRVQSFVHNQINYILPVSNVGKFAL